MRPAPDLATGVRRGSATLVVVVLCLVSAPHAATAESASCEATKVVRAIDDLMRGQRQVALLEMRVVRPRSTRTLRLRFWFQAGSDGGEDSVLARVEAPAAERGVASLRLGQKMWSFVPSTGRVQQVPESMMLSSWMGSDWTNDDMVRESSLLDDYEERSCELVDLDGDAYRIELRARKGREVSWEKIILVARRGGEDDLLPLREEFYSKRAGELVLARTMVFSDSKVMGGRRLPARMVLEPAGRSGQRTEMRYLSVEFDAAIPPDVFSLRNLQRPR